MAALPIGNKYTPRTTPLHVYQLVLLTIRETFRNLPEDHIYLLTEDINTTGVLVDTTYNKDSDGFGKKPLIVVNRGAASTSPAFLGDTAIADMRLGAELKSSLVYSSVAVKIIAEHFAQVDILSNEIFNLLLTCRTFIPHFTSVHSITNVAMSDVTPFTQSVNLRMCTVMMSYAMQYKWTSIPPQLLLDSVAQNIYTPEAEPEEPSDIREVVSTFTPSA